MNLEEEAKRGQEAKEFLNHSIFKNVVEEINAALEGKILTTPTTDKEACADVIRSKQLFEMMVRQIENYVETGKLAENDLLVNKNLN